MLEPVYQDRRVLDVGLLQRATDARDHAFDLQNEADRAQVDYQHAIRGLHAAGASLREIAEGLGLSYQRVHQIVDVGSGKGAVKECRTDRECGFCGRGQGQVDKLISGPGVFICGACVDLASKVLAARQERSSDWARLVPESEPGARCSFCGKRGRGARGLVAAPDRPAMGKFGRGFRASRSSGVRVCSECLTLCNKILAEQPS